MENSITVGEELRKYFYESGLYFLSSVPQRRIQEMILAMAQKGHSGKMTDCGELGAGHRTTYGHFLSKGKWNHEKVETVQRQKSFQTILSVAEKANQPVYLSIDDTVVPKKKPSRRAMRPMEGTGWHYSHLEGKKVYGYQIHAAIAGTGSSILCYSLRRCCPEHGTEVDMTVEVIDSIQESEIPIYVLMDSWYTNADVWNKCKEKKCHLIGAMKTTQQGQTFHNDCVPCRPLREFCVSDFRQNQEYHVFNVHDGGLFPLSTSVPEGWDGMRAVYGVNAVSAFRESYFKGNQPTWRSLNMISSWLSTISQFWHRACQCLTIR